MLGEVLAEVDEDIRADYIEDLTASDVEQIVKGQDAQEVAEVLDVADEEIKTTVYASLDQEIRAQVENLHAYEEDMVGRYMDPETVNVKQGVSLEAVQRYIRIHHLLDDDSQQGMITDKEKRLLGTLTLIDLVKQPQGEHRGRVHGRCSLHAQRPDESQRSRRPAALHGAALCTGM